MLLGDRVQDASKTGDRRKQGAQSDRDHDVLGRDLTELFNLSGIDDIAIDSSTALTAALSSNYKAGDTATITVVRQQEDAENGEVVVAMIDDEATVKRIYFEKTQVRLQPENDYMDPIYADEVVILGKVVALLRQY